MKTKGFEPCRLRGFCITLIRLTRQSSATAGGSECRKHGELFQKIRCASLDGQRSAYISWLARIRINGTLCSDCERIVTPAAKNPPNLSPHTTLPSPQAGTDPAWRMPPRLPAS